MPSAPPSVGKNSAARMLKRKMTEMDWAISSSSAPMTGAVAAMAEPPQMEEPTPTSTEMLHGILSQRLMAKAMTSEVVMVEQMMGSDLLPTWAIWERLSPNPSRMTAYCNTFLEVKAMPARKEALFWRTSAASMPSRMANTGPPTTGKAQPSSQPGMASARHSSRPGSVCLTEFISIHSLFPIFS